MMSRRKRSTKRSRLEEEKGSRATLVQSDWRLHVILATMRGVLLPQCLLLGSLCPTAQLAQARSHASGVASGKGRRVTVTVRRLSRSDSSPCLCRLLPSKPYYLSLPLLRLSNSISSSPPSRNSPRQQSSTKPTTNLPHYTNLHHG